MNDKESISISWMKQYPWIEDMNDDLISRRAAIEAIRTSASKYTGFMGMEMYTDDDAVEAIEGVPSAQPTLYGYNIEHLELIARVLQKEDLPPERVVDALKDIGRIVSIVTDEFEVSIRKAVEQCMT